VTDASTFNFYGQELSPQTWAINRSDRLIPELEGKDAEIIKFGRALSDDQLAKIRFAYQFANPPYGGEGSKAA
jgi:type I restriction enzyme M protein